MSILFLQFNFFLGLNQKERKYLLQTKGREWSGKSCYWDNQSEKKRIIIFISIFPDFNFINQDTADIDKDMIAGVFV